MRVDEFSISKLLKLLSCFLIDVAVILGYIKVFSLFTALEPAKSIFLLLILLASLFILNAAIFFPYMLFKRIGVTYSAAFIMLSVGYALAANLIALLFISISLIGLIVCELVVLGVLLGIFAVIASFANKVSETTEMDQIEQVAKISIDLQLIDIEAALAARAEDEGMVTIQRSFKALRERINASTPFGRVSGGNRKMIEIENAVRSNLEYIHLQVKSALPEKNASSIKQLLDETLRLVMNREALNIR